MAKKVSGNFYQGFASTNTGIKGTNIFSIGENLENFAVQTNMEDRVVRDIENNLNGFSQPITLETLNISQPAAQQILDNNVNIFLNTDKNNVKNYAYFGSLSEFIRVAVENIITNFPASLYISNDIDPTILLTVLDYNYNVNTKEATFKVPVSAIDNKYNLTYTQKSYLFSSTGNSKDISLNYLNYSIWDFNTEYPIIGFTGTTDPTTGYLYFQVTGNPFPNAISSGNILNKFHVKPNYNNYENFINGLEDFEAYLLNRDSNPQYSAIFKDIVQTQEGTPIFVDKVFVWKTTDGYNLDYDTYEYEQYLVSLLNLADSYDNYKTNLISRFLTTTSLKEFDTPDQKMDKLLKIYGREFDEIKRFIDGLANINKVTYNKKDNIPDQLIKNLAKTLGWGTFSTMTEDDLMKAFLGQPSNITFSGQTKNLTPVETDIELWRRLVINSAYLFKSKGTRSCIDFLFKIIGAPSSLIDFNEFVYLVDGKIDVNAIVNNADLNYPFDADGYPVVQPNTADYYFQMKGGWRTTIPLAPNNDKNLISAIGVHTGDYDNGKLYFDNFAKFDDQKGFTLEKTIDNVKSWIHQTTGATRANVDRETGYDIQNSKMVLNTKEIDLYLDPAKAIEYDVFKFNQDNDYPISFYGLPYPYPDNVITRRDVSSMTFVEYLDFVYSAFINAKNRKVATDNFGGGYPTLQRLYYEYYYQGFVDYDRVWSEQFNEPYGNNDTISPFEEVFEDAFQLEGITGATVTLSNRLNFQKVQKYIDMIDGFWLSLLEQFIPSTTIWEGGKKYRNTIYERQKYVYKHGINDGSEFTTKQKEKDDIEANVVVIKGSVNLPYIGNISNRVKVDNIFSSSISFPEPGDSGNTSNHINVLRVHPWVTGNTTVFHEPVYYMQQADKIHSGETEPVRHNISVDLKQVTVVFTANTASMVTSNPQTKFRYRVYPFDYPTSSFTQTALYTRVTDQDFSGQTGTLTLNDTIPYTFKDGDYLIKGSFIYTGSTANTFGYNFNMPISIDTESFNVYPYYDAYAYYDADFDYWFTIISNPAKPLIDTDIYDVSYQPTNSGLTLVSKQLVFSGETVTGFTYDQIPLGDPIINVNGNILLKSSNSGLTDGDYFIQQVGVGTTIKITIREGVSQRRNDTITITHLKSTSETNAEIASESQVVYSIPSGATDASPGSQIYYNTSGNTFEYYTDFLIGQEVSFDDLVVLINGNTLLKGTDYIPSATNKSKFRLLVPIEVGDTIIIFYPTQDLTKFLYLNNKQLNVRWTALTDTANGKFTAQCALASDVNFTNILYSASTPYLTFATPTSNTYTVYCGDVTTPNQTFILRVKSEKYFTNMLGEVITTTTYSDILTFKTDNRVLS